MFIDVPWESVNVSQRVIFRLMLRIGKFGKYARYKNMKEVLIIFVE